MIGPRSLFGKLLLLFLAFGAVMTGVYVFMMGVAHKRYHLELAQTFNRPLAQEYVAGNLLIAGQPLTARNASQALHQITAINPNVDLYVLDGHGRILDASTSTGRRRVQDRVDIGPIEQFLSGRASFPLLDIDPSGLRTRDVFSVAPLSIAGTSARYLYVVLNRRENGRIAERLQTDYNLGQDAGVILVAALFAFAASIVFLRMLTRRLGALQQDMEHFRGGQLPPAAAGACRDATQADEIGRLRSEFQCLAECIRRQMRELGKNDAILRELLANVSHDLRTPLATLQAELETLALRSNLSEDELRDGLAVALRHSRRLGRLTADLLELAQLDAGQVRYSPEQFQLAELLQDAVLSHELEARRAGVTLHFQPPGDKVPRVLGDIALLGRVLDILLENAVRHAGTDGRVNVGLDPAPERVCLWVRNSGPGIPATERDRVFERFYRGDKTRSTQTGAAGLGLAIAREILALHGRSIDLRSDPGEGTTFFFDLPVAASAVLPPEHRPSQRSSLRLFGKGIAQCHARQPVLGTSNRPG